MSAFMDWLEEALKIVTIGLVVVVLMVSYAIWNNHRHGRPPKTPVK